MKANQLLNKVNKCGPWFSAVIDSGRRKRLCGVPVMQATDYVVSALFIQVSALLSKYL